jgi:hypothetical protein
MFGLLAARRGPHWNLTVADHPALGRVDEAATIAEAIAGVMQHVPLPTKEVGIAADLGTLGIALYATIAPRLELDRQYAAAYAKQHAETEPTGSQAAAPAPPYPGAEHEVANDVVHGRDPFAGMPTDPLAAVTHNGPTLGPEETGEADPELHLADRLDVEPVRVEDAVAAAGADADRPLLDRLAPPPIVNGENAQGEMPTV